MLKLCLDQLQMVLCRLQFDIDSRLLSFSDFVEIDEPLVNLIWTVQHSDDCMHINFVTVAVFSVTACLNIIIDNELTHIFDKLFLPTR